MKMNIPIEIGLVSYSRTNNGLNSNHFPLHLGPYMYNKDQQIQKAYDTSFLLVPLHGSVPGNIEVSTNKARLTYMYLN